MYCPKCGQQQVSDATKYCSRCGFFLEGVALVLASGGQIPTRYVQPGNKKLSPRSQGIRQGAMLMLSTLLLVPLVAIITVNFLEPLEFLIAVTAIVCFVGGLLRILYALLMQDEVAPLEPVPAVGYSPPVTQFDSSMRNALPPASANAATGWRPRPNTADIYQPPSITENTTRLLNKDDPETR
ncbi:MAG: zinc ribbon domain-containing protein [Acidobacteriota bacterium]|nr:zinc ribbon domain-containing protein [Acidobacteriota bacterium]